VAKDLPEPFGSPPARPAKYVLYISRHGDDDTQCIVQSFAARYSGRKFLDVLLRDDGIHWDDECTVRSETGIVVSTRWWPGLLRRVVEHEYSIAEMAWSLRDYAPEVYRAAKTFRNGPDLPRTLEETPTRERRTRAASAPRASAPSGYVHVSDIALSMGIDAKQARVALRKIYPQKPATGWSFPPGEIEALKTKIKEVIK
jgi:hypothetical protein